MATDQSLYFPSILIEGFKAIDDLKIDSLAPMNLLTGDNNVGKSTILEALYIYAFGGTYNVLSQVAFDRTNCSRTTRFDDDGEFNRSLMASFFKNWKLELGQTIRISAEAKISFEMSFVYFYEEEQGADEGRIYRRHIVRNEGDLEKSNSFDLKDAIFIEVENEGTLIPLSGRSNRKKDLDLKNIQFIRTSSFSNEINARLWDNITLTDQEVDVINALKIIEPDIKGIAFLEEPVRSYLLEGHRRVPYITYNSKPGRFPLSVMGDGMNRILALVLGLVNSANGLCLIDEIENGIYYRRQPDLWKVIAHLVEKLNIQLFATTHSNDCIKSFADVAVEGNAKLIRLEKREKGIKAVDYTAEELSVAADNDIEVR